MAINPLIALQAKAPDVGDAFSNILLDIQRGQQIRQTRAEQPIRQQLLQAQAGVAQAQNAAAQAQLPFADQDAATQRRFLEARADTSEANVPSAQAEAVERQNEGLQFLTNIAGQTLPMVQGGNVDGARNVINQQLAALDAQGISASAPAQALNESLGLLDTNPELFAQNAQQLVDLSKQNQQGNRVQQAVAVPGLGFQTLSRTGEAELIQLPPEQQAAIAAQSQKKRDIELDQLGAKERIKQQEVRTSALKTELSTRNRNASRSGRIVREALTLVGQADQGLTGVAKLQLSRLIPGINADDEGALDSVLKQLSLEQLQNFKGPTTNFEFGVTEAITGQLGQGATANRARLNSLSRAGWFQKREFDQYQRHVNAGGDPDSFRFNFGETVKTKKGVFTLQDIQDTAAQNHLSIEDTIKRLNQ